MDDSLQNTMSQYEAMLNQRKEANWGDMQPHVHLNTSNLSALKMHDILSQLGVKNNKFMLTIFDTDLMYINPFDKNLSVEMQRRVHAEIVRNYWYYLREIVRINVPGGTTSFEFHRGNLALSWLLINSINTYVELPRQTTKTGTIASFFSYIWGFRAINSKSAFLSKDPESVKSNLNDVKVILDNLPWHLRMLDPVKDRSNTEFIESSTTENSIVTRNPPGSEAVAINKGRGSREPWQFYDEINFIKFVKTIILNSSSSWQQAAEFAKRNGIPYGRVFASTPGILGTDSGDYMFEEFIPQCMEFNENLFYDQPSIDGVRDVISAESKNDFVKVRFTFRQLGKDEAYFKRQCRNLQNDKETIDREVNLLWSRRSENSPFTKEQLDRVFNNLKSPIGTILVQQIYVLKLYKKPDWKKCVLISVDCSGMTDNDYSSVVVTDPQTFEIIGSLRSNARTNYSNTTRFSMALMDMAINIFPNAILAIEKNNMGITVIDNIVTFGPPELLARLYSSQFEPFARNKNNINASAGFDMDGNPTDYNDGRVVYGFGTNATTRGQMFSEIIGILITELYDVINDVDIFYELQNIIRTVKGRLDHKRGKHDDILFAYLIGLWVLCYSKILTTRYGFPMGYVRPMSLIDEADGVTTGMSRPSDNTCIDDLTTQMISTELRNRGQGNPFETKRIHGIDTRDSISEDYSEDVNNRNMSGSEIADLVFGGKESLIEDENEESSINLIEPVIDAPDAYEDIQHSMMNMDKTSRTQFDRKQQEDLYGIVAQTKNYRVQNMNKAREVKELNRLEKLRKETGDTSSHIDTLLDGF